MVRHTNISRDGISADKHWNKKAPSTTSVGTFVSAKIVQANVLDGSRSAAREHSPQFEAFQKCAQRSVGCDFVNGWSYMASARTTSRRLVPEAPVRESLVALRNRWLL